MRLHSLVSQLPFCHHHLHNVPESFILHLLSVFCYVAEADAGYLPHVLGWELERVGGTAVKGQKNKKVTTTGRVCSGFDSEQWTVKFTGLPESFSFVRLMGLGLLRAEAWRTESEATR